MMIGLGAVSQSAIDACTAQGGHMIIFPDGIPSCEVPSDPATRLPAYTGPAVEVGPAYSGIDWGSIVLPGGPPATIPDTGAAARGVAETARRASLCGRFSTYVERETPPMNDPGTQELRDQQERGLFCELKPEVMVGGVVLAAITLWMLLGGKH